MKTQAETAADYAPLADDIIELGVASTDTHGIVGNQEPNGQLFTGISED
ncbi:benenodin family lasso peptide [Asticcacaulis sp. BYS171W]|uniref:Benenodin family lasso peptide n=1 Tax=Asticcacaulis aquaticus TaxID=2984212 RepID=A0ABT5HQ03_9CAUL|nr:benenodin family lasso peptide [Asticcacaulis aquaticus]MDC7682153.1 benenodin family lasso peptide [Asticcacaulis aquaticus]